MASIIQQLNEGSERYDEARLDHLLQCLEINPDYIKQKASEEASWREDIAEFVSESLATMQGFVPPRIFSESEHSLVDMGYSLRLAKRMLQKKALWLVRMQPQDIAKIHFAELMNKYNYEGNNLDVVELAAVYASLPERFLNDHNEKKAQWRLNLGAALRKNKELMD